MVVRIGSIATLSDIYWIFIFSGEICKMNVIEAPNKLEFTNNSIFLAGTIDNGDSFDWQSEVIKSLNGFDITILNPRRKDWDSSWKQTIDDPQFYEQVNWELDALDKADFILMYFAPESKSPISLLELGLYANSNKLIVCCPDGFYRKGNVEIVCKRYGISLFNSLELMTNLFMMCDAHYQKSI